jgi:ribosomal protein S18 acetylase RimI-like enzyme
MTHIRPIRLPEDQGAVLQLDTSFTTERIYRVAATALSFTLVEESIQPALYKSFALTDEFETERMWEYATVAEENGSIVGFIALRSEIWNRRTAIWHLYVESHQRGKGIGKQLIAASEAYARSTGSRCLWLETSNVNYPAIQFYQQVGFTLCGLDQTLYEPDGDGVGETALYFAKTLV